MKHVGDITKLKGSQLEPVDVICGGSPCFVAGTMVFTDRGNIPIEDVNIGDKVLTHTNSWKTVTDKFKTISNDLYELQVSGTLKTVVTGNHPYYVCESFKLRNTETDSYTNCLTNPHWVNVRDLSPELYIGFPINPVEDESISITSEEAWLLGRYVADGYVNNSQRSGRPIGQINHKVIFCIRKHKALDFESHLVKYHACKNEDKTVIKYEIINERFMNLCIQCGKGAINKHIPNFILNAPDFLLTEFLLGYFSGDGTYVKTTKQYVATTISKTLAFDLQCAIHKAYKSPCFVYYCKRPSEHIIEDRTVHQHDTYIVKFRTELTAKSHSIVTDSMIWQPVKKITSLSYTDTVYNLEVEDDHSYMANGVVVHNCQNLSMAGNRMGLEGQESRLFLDQIRVIKEMRERDKANGIPEYKCRPRYMVWENVWGSLTCSNGNDFRRVLEETIRIIEPEAPDLSLPEAWTPAGCLYDDMGRWSVAWRVHDAQFWGVPQRRKRIALVADFGGLSAPEVLFERKGMSWNTDTSQEQRKRITRNPKISTDKASLW